MKSTQAEQPTARAMTPSTRIGVTELRPRCLEHVEREEATLRVVIDALRQTRAALLGGKPGALEAAIDVQQSVREAADEVRNARDRLRADLAFHLGLSPADVTLTRIAEYFTKEERILLEAEQRRLKELAGEADRLSQELAGLVYHGLLFLTQLLGELTSAAPGVGYGPGGRAINPAGGPFLDARG